MEQNKQDAIDKVMVSAILFKYHVPVDEAKLIGAFIERLEKERDEYKDEAWRYRELCK